MTDPKTLEAIADAQRAEMEAPDYKAKLFALRKDWYARARGMTLQTLPGFLSELSEHRHDYSSIVYAVAAAALGAASALDRGPTGGITGFQAGAVFWEFFSEWLHEQGKPARIVRYENMLYPQYEAEFEKTITRDTWNWLQKEAEKHLAERGKAVGEVVDHWISIASGRVPFGFSVSGD